MGSKFQILTVLWSEPYLTWFLNGCFKSLCFEQNANSLKDHCTTWNIYCDDDQIDKIREAALKAQTKFPHLFFAIRSTKYLRAFTDQHQSALCWQIDECIKAKERLLFAPPDTIFADGTVKSLVKMGREKGTCVAVAHPRVLPEILGDMKDLLHRTPAHFVRLSWKHLHQSWTDAEVGHLRQNSFIGGVKWEELRPQIYSVTHHLPTVYFADFTPEDLMYFRLKTSFGSYDHEWPAEVLLRQCRQRLVGSSDAAFIMEITHREKNIPPVQPGDTDGFWRNHAHNIQNRMTNVIFRGEW